MLSIVSINKAKVHEIPQTRCNSLSVGWRLGDPGLAGGGTARSHLKNQQLLTLNMLIFFVLQIWRLPAF